MSQTSLAPLLRGRFHQIAFVLSFVAGVFLVAKATDSRALVASLIYTLGLLTLFGVSALYHRKKWSVKKRAWMKRVDHSAIFIFIACTFTPICFFALPIETGRALLTLVWIVAFFGVIQSLFWVRAPKWATAILYVGFGWIAVFYLRDLSSTLNPENLAFLIAGGLTYTAGAVFYALKRPNLVPGIFGYHELFHVFTIVGAGFHFVVIYGLIR